MKPWEIAVSAATALLTALSWLAMTIAAGAFSFAVGTLVPRIAGLIAFAVYGLLAYLAALYSPLAMYVASFMPNPPVVLYARNAIGIERVVAPMIPLWPMVAAAAALILVTGKLLERSGRIGGGTVNRLSYRAIVIIALIALVAFGTTARTWRVGSRLLDQRLQALFDIPDLHSDIVEASRSFHETIGLDGIDSLDVSVALGDITVVREPGSSILLRGTANGSVEFVRDLELLIGRQGTTALVDAQHPDDSESTQSRRRGSVDMQLAVPDGISVTLHTDAGLISVSGIKGDIKASSGFGSIRMAHTQGDIDAFTSMGTISVASAIVPRRLSLATSMGDVSFAGTLGSSNTIRVNAGRVSLDVPETTCVNIDAQVSAGRISSELPLTRLEQQGAGTFAAGTLGSSSPRGDLHIRVDFGDVTIRER